MNRTKESRLHINSSSIRKIFHDIFFIFFLSHCQAGVQHSDAARSAVAALHPRPHLAIHGLLWARQIGLDWIGLDWIGLDWIGLDGYPSLFLFLSVQFFLYLSLSPSYWFGSDQKGSTRIKWDRIVWDQSDCLMISSKQRPLVSVGLRMSQYFRQKQLIVLIVWSKDVRVDILYTPLLIGFHHLGMAWHSIAQNTAVQPQLLVAVIRLDTLHDLKVKGTCSPASQELLCRTCTFYSNGRRPLWATQL